MSKRADHVEAVAQGTGSMPGESPERTGGLPPEAGPFAPPRPSAPGESEDRFRSLLRFSSDWYWEQDENFRFTANLRGFPERPGIRARQLRRQDALGDAVLRRQRGAVAGAQGRC